MPVVKVNGVANPMQFPDDMDINDIRAFLQKRFAQRAIEGESDILAPRPDTIEPYEPSLVEKAGQGIASALTNSGIISDNYGAQRIGKNLSALGEFLPGIGDATAGDEFGRAVAEGDYGTAALNAVGTVPILGDMAIFAGALAKNADLGALRKAKMLEDTGADRDEIWKETGWFNDKGDWKFEVSDALDFDTGKGADINPSSFKMIKDYGGTAQQNFMGHPELFEAYPNLADRYVSAMDGGGGKYNPKTDTISIGDKLLDPDRATVFGEARSVNLHELQHAIQEREGFARGGSPERASYFLKNNKDEVLKEYSGKRYQAASALFDTGKYGEAEYIAKLDRISKSDNIKPSSVTSLSDWYQYSDQIRDKFGVMPKTNEKGRNQWLQSAAAFIKNRNMDDMDYHGKVLVNDAIKDPKHIRSQYKKAEREFKKYEPEFKKYAQEERKYKKLEDMSDFDKYMRLAGEAESRNVEKRMDWTPEQRRATPPWKSLDVPEDELIYRKSPNN